MSQPKLRIGQINYLNIRPVFQLLRQYFLPGSDIEYIVDHPAQLNQAIYHGQIDIGPCSSFEYLQHGSTYLLLPHMCIAAKEQVQSVLLISPVPKDKLPDWIQKDKTVFLSSASATSSALLKILWKLSWKFPEPEWKTTPPGRGQHQRSPFLEIGDPALQLYLSPPKGWHIIDLASEWNLWTGLPFVFAVWIIRKGLEEGANSLIREMGQYLLSIQSKPDNLLEKARQSPDFLPSWLSRGEARNYWENVHYAFEPQEWAGLLLYGHYCRELGLLPDIPGLQWFSL